MSQFAPDETADAVTQDVATDAAPALEPAETPAEEAAPDPDVEAEARAMGWRPREEYKGDPDKWKPADQFVSHGRQILPLVQENLRRATDKISRMEREHAAAIEGIRRTSELALQRQREQIVAGFEAAKRDAIQVGDVERYDALNHQQWQEVQRFDQQARQQMQPQQPRLPDDAIRAFDDFRSRNRWFGVDQELTAVAVAFNDRNAREKPHLSMAENIRETEAYLAQRYPEAFPSRRMGGAAPVEGASRGSVVAGRRGKGAADLPAEARKHGEQFVKEGLFKNINEYAEVFWRDQ